MPKSPAASTAIAEEVERRLRILRKDPEARARYDFDASGVLEDDEWALLRRIVAAEVEHGIARDGSVGFDEAPLTGVVAERFEVLGLLGVGGQGRTWLARDLLSGERVALKELAIGRVVEWKAVELFEREGELLSALEHPQIPHYISAFHAEVEGADDGPRLFLAQEYVAGRSLEEDLASTHWSEAEAIELLRSMLDVLGYLHGLSPPVVHRDIKPSNIMRLDGGGYALIDFGAVSTVSPTLTGGSTVVGTSGYMPLEQFMGRAVPATDLYALGATLVRLLSRRHPADLPIVRSRLQFEDATNVSKELEAVLRRMLEPNVEDRYADAEAVRADLDDLDGAKRRERERREEAERRARREREREADEQAKRLRRDLARRERRSQAKERRAARAARIARAGGKPGITVARLRGWSARVVGWAFVAQLVLWASPRCGSYQPAIEALETCETSRALLGEDAGQRFFGLAGPSFRDAWVELPGRDAPSGGGLSWRMAVSGSEDSGVLVFRSGEDRSSLAAARLLVDDAEYQVLPCDGTASNDVLHCDGATCVSEALPHNLVTRLLWAPCGGGSFSYEGSIDFEPNYDELVFGSQRYSGRDARVFGAATGAVWIGAETDGSVDSLGVRSLTARCGVVRSSPYLSCDGLSCTTEVSPLPHNLDETTMWDPCNGRAFLYDGLIDLETGYDTLTVRAPEQSGGGSALPGVLRERVHTGRDAQIQGLTAGPVSLHLHTDSSASSAGVQYLRASCWARGDEMPAVFGDSRYLECDETRCRTTRSPLPHSLDESVLWMPCGGAPYRYTLDIDFEACCDYVSLGDQRRTGRDNRMTGLASGPMVVSVHTDGSVDSGGLRELRAECVLELDELW